MTTPFPVKKKPLVVSCSMEEFRDHSNSMDGICLACGEWSEGGCEPDARGYPCDSCGEDRVMGAEDAMILGRVLIP